jgi:hypothetical protein
MNTITELLGFALRRCMNSSVRRGGQILMLAAASVVQAGTLPRIEDFRADLSEQEINADRDDRVRHLASLAYQWGFPAFLNFRQATEFKLGRKHLAPEEEPFGGWTLVRHLSTPETNNALPNADTLYGASYLRLDLHGAVVLEIPPIRDRYFSVAVLDAYFHNTEVLGSRTVGSNGARVLLAPPGWARATPEGIDRVVVVPTPSVTLLQRIHVKSEEDVAAVRELQDRIRLAPLSRWRSADEAFPRIDTPEYDAKDVRGIRDPAKFFGIVNWYTGLNPPPQEMRGMTALFGTIGLGPGARLPVESEMIGLIAQGASMAQRAINARISGAPARNGWQLPSAHAGKFSLEPLEQAVTQITQIGVLPPEEALYFTSSRDSSGAILDGRNSYRLTFARDALPPVDALGFWSVTMYRAADLLLVPNEISRYLIRPGTKGLETGADGSLTIHIAAQRPAGSPPGNWLPAPPEPFQLALRTYLPLVQVRDGSWVPPAVTRVQVP